MRSDPLLNALAFQAVASGDAGTIELAARLMGLTPDDLRDAAAAAERMRDDELAVQSGAVLVRLADVQPEPVTWLWPQKIAERKLTLIAGDPGLGKSFLTLDIAARVSTGAGWPDAPGQRFAPGGVVLLSAEDDLADTVRLRADAAGADAARIVALQAVEHRDPESGATMRAAFTLDDMPALEAAITRTPDCRLVVIDPISAFMGGADSHVNAEVRAALAPLSDLAARYRVAVLAVTHLRKGEGPAIYRSTGSLAFVAAARACWAVVKDKDDATGKRRLLLPVKNNLGNDTTGLAFELRPAGLCASIAWDTEPVTVSADEAMAGPRQKPGPDADDREAAAAWLRAALADGPRPAKDIEGDAREAEGISKATLRRAKDALKVEAYRPENPGPWYWRLPSRAHAHTCAPAPRLEHLEHLEHLPLNTVDTDTHNRQMLRLSGNGRGGEHLPPADDLGALCSDPVEGEQ